jgi:tRNA A-37 threonylcarbamoyl transferase component Bud32
VPVPDASSPLAADSLLGNRYRIVRPVANGGMAAVWEGHDEVLARAVAVKVLHPHLAVDQVFQERFRREAIAAARLSHPNVVATFDAGTAANGTAYIVMELVRGTTLREFMAGRGRLAPELAIGIAIQIADALRHAHAAGLVHRDIKPANVLLWQSDSGTIPQVKVTDFGIAKAAEGMGLDLTGTGMVLGTPKYLSPEQVEGREPDARADLYALGVVLFEMLTGDPPFAGPTDIAVALARLNQPAPRLADRLRGVPPDLDRLVTALMAIDTATRPPSAAAVRQALAAIRPSSGNETAGVAWGPAVPTAPGRGAATGTGRTRGFGRGPGRGPASAGTPTTVGPGAAGGAAGTPTTVGPGGAVGGAVGVPTTFGQGNSARGPGGTAAGTWPAAGGTRVAGQAAGHWAPSTGAPAGPSGTGGPPTFTRQGGRSGGPAAGSRAPRSRRRPRYSPWPGRVVMVLVAVTAVVTAVVVFGRPSNPSSHSTAALKAPKASPAATVAIRDVSVYHLERNADNAATVGYTHDGNPATVWMTDHYFGPNFAGLRHGLGLAISVGGSHRLHQLQVQSPTRGWSAQVYLASAIPAQVSLASWGQPVAIKQGIVGNTVDFDLGGRQAGAILLWITDLGPANVAGVAELTVS